LKTAITFRECQSQRIFENPRAGWEIGRWFPVCCSRGMTQKRFWRYDTLAEQELQAFSVYAPME
jgi:hypothetical protein